MGVRKKAADGQGSTLAKGRNRSTDLESFRPPASGVYRSHPRIARASACRETGYLESPDMPRGMMSFLRSLPSGACLERLPQLFYFLGDGVLQLIDALARNRRDRVYFEVVRPGISLQLRQLGFVCHVAL